MHIVELIVNNLSMLVFFFFLTFCLVTNARFDPASSQEMATFQNPIHPVSALHFSFSKIQYTRIYVTIQKKQSAVKHFIVAKKCYVVK